MFKIFLILILFTLSNCGFAPLYKKSDYDPNVFSRIKLTQVQGENKLKIRKKIIDFLNLQSSEDDLYELQISYNRSRYSLGIARNGLTYRYGVNYSLSYNLLDLKNNFKIANDNISLSSSYDVTDSEFANFTAGDKSDENTENQLIEELRNKIYLDLKSYNNEN